MKCIVCQRTEAESFHRLPKDENKRNTWLKACGLEKYVKPFAYKSLLVCSLHFSFHDYRITRPGAPRILKPDAVPSICTPSASEHPMEQYVYIISTDLKAIEYVKIESNIEDMPSTSSDLPENVEIINQSKIELNEFTPSTSSNVEDYELKPLPQDVEETKLPVLTEPAGQKTKRTIWRPSRVGDCRPEHLLIPGNLDLIKSELKKKQRQIKLLQQRNNRLVQKVTSLKTVIRHLKSKELLTENTGNVEAPRIHPDKSYTCEYCREAFAHPEPFQRHLRGHLAPPHHSHLRGHRGDSVYSCHACHKKFRSLPNFKRHFRIVHLGARAHECMECHKKFGAAKTLEEHMSIHTGEYLFVCDVCNGKFQHETSFKMHLQQHNEEEREVPNRAPSRETSPRAPRAGGVTCPLCDKTFRFSSHLRRHQLVHSGQKPHVCPQCSRGFSQRSTLRRHLECHARGTLPRTGALVFS